MAVKRQTRTNLVAYAFLTPAILGLVFMTTLPILGVVAISLTHWTGLVAPTFIGLDNYREIFTGDLYFLPSVVATLYFAVGAVVTGTLYAFAIAMMLNQKIPARGFFRSVFFLPYVVPIIGASHRVGLDVRSQFRGLQLRPQPPGHRQSEVAGQ